jgi:hypothetical protein
MYSTVVVLLHVLPSLVPIFLESITRSVTDYHQVLYLMGAPLSGKITTGISRDKMKKRCTVVNYKLRRRVSALNFNGIVLLITCRF